jgi:flavin-dependent dehydrogenase
MEEYDVVVVGGGVAGSVAARSAAKRGFKTLLVEKFKARYLIGADGMLSKVRRRLRPQDFGRKASGSNSKLLFCWRSKP